MTQPFLFSDQTSALYAVKRLCFECTATPPPEAGMLHRMTQTIESIGWESVAHANVQAIQEITADFCAGCTHAPKNFALEGESAGLIRLLELGTVSTLETSAKVSLMARKVQSQFSYWFCHSCISQTRSEHLQCPQGILGLP